MFLYTSVYKISNFVLNIYAKILLDYKSKNVCPYGFVNSHTAVTTNGNISNYLAEEKNDLVFRICKFPHNSCLWSQYY